MKRYLMFLILTASATLACSGLRAAEQPKPASTAPGAVESRVGSPAAAGSATAGGSGEAAQSQTPESSSGAAVKFNPAGKK